MDSGNSGSMQSSSCGDEINNNNNNNNEEYDSRAESNFSSFLNNPLPTQPYTNPRASSSSSSLPQQMFDPLSNYYMDSLQKSPPPNQNSFLNLDMVWSKATTRSEPNNADLISSSQQNQAFLLSQLTGQTRIDVAASLPTTHQSLRGGSLTNDQQTLNNNNNNNNSNNNVVRNPKKRSRASRRAPTTVLTTDTTNFRAMVQEFTGIPAPPFSSPFPRTRLDLFGSSRSVSMESHQQQPPPYLLRPFAQKIQPLHHSFSSFQPSSSMVENSTCTNSPSINYHLLQQQQNPLNMHNQILGFQSNNINSQTHPKYQLGSLSNKTTLEITPNVDSHMKMSVFEELGLSHTHAHVSNNNNIGVVHQQNMIPASSSDGVNNNMRNIPNSEDRGGINYRNDIEERESNGKGSECVGVATRGEGTVESWINCSSH
ncbi:uncharacterized protein [Cicer arietinum]|uniref:Homeobox protein 4 n=1 Tax=Cicer arietinum TaxID=3827 RepID=A0A1S2YCS3_CICAR|nr:homeobox protein 4 [Cicer arietinum]